MSTTITCHVHTDAKTHISCRAIDTSRSTVQLDTLTIFASEPELRRLADTINERLAVIEAETMQVAA